jgi:type II secretory pathway pseudopilin PulG
MNGSTSTPRPDKEAGFTLIEALVVMIVGIVILAAAAAGIGKLFRTSEISNEAENITQIVANVRNLKNGANGYADISNALAVQYKAVPATMTTSTGDGGTKIFNSWNGDVTIAPAKGNRQAFSITYGGVPPEACQQLLIKLRSVGWVSMKAGSTRLWSTSSLSAISGACKAKANTLEFITTA